MGANDSTRTGLATLGHGWLISSLVLWFVASFAGSMGGSLPRSAILTTSNGASIAQCTWINPDAVTSGQAQPQDWCTLDEVLGSRPPSDAKSSPGPVIMDPGRLWESAFEVFLRPDLWLTVGVGGVAIVLLFAFSRATGTVRAGLAVAISMIFFGLLLFPRGFTSLVASDLRSELVTAWQLVVLFYFGSEAVVQAIKVVKPEGTGVTGDIPPENTPVRPRKTGTEEQEDRGTHGQEGAIRH